MPTWEQERAKHYRMIETNQAYRNAIKLDWIEAENAPAITPYEPTPVLEKPARVIGIPIKEWRSLQGELRALENRLNEHLDYKKKTDAF